MTSLAALIALHPEREWLVPSGVLALPIALALWSWHTARKPSQAGEGKENAWPWYLPPFRFVLAATVGAWWTAWDFNGLALQEVLLFWIPPLISLGIFIFLAYNNTVIRMNATWTFIDVLRLTWWRLMNFVVPLLLTTQGLDDLLHGYLSGCAWIGLAGSIAFVSRFFLSRAEGMKLHEVKASETRNRALAMARNLGIDLNSVYVVPAGRGHLTNAFASWTSIGLTDNLGKYFNRPQIDFVIAHELAHIEKKHLRIDNLLMIGVFSVVTGVVFSFRRELALFRPVIDMLLIIVPLAILYFFSRRQEYEADRRAVELTGDPESGVRVTMCLPRVTGQSMQCSRLTELFMTHPAPIRRVEAICRAASIPADEIADMIRDIRLDKRWQKHVQMKRPWD